MIPIVFSLDVAYNHRMEYPMVKNNTANIDVILDQIHRRIEHDNVRDYIILLGDSVAYSGPGSSQQSIGPYLEQYYQEQGEVITVFNLAMPAMQVGDIYTMLLKLDQHNISTDRLIFNVIYAGFAERQPDPPIVFWLQDDLSRLDHTAFENIKPALEANQWTTEKNFPEKVNHLVTNNLTLFSYKDFIKADVIHRIDAFHGIKRDDSLGDNRPWYEKEGLKEALNTPAYQKGFSINAFDMSKTNPQICFLDKIARHQEGKKALVFLGPVNPELMEQVNLPEYQDNLQQIQHYFSNDDWQYIDFHGQIDENLFTDHVHLIAEGYQVLARELGENFVIGAKNR